MKGLVVFSFALRGEALEPNPCNINLGNEVAKIIKAENDEVLVVAQWEVAKWLQTLGIKPALISELRSDGSYLDSAGVLEDAAQLFEAHGVTDVIPVAQPWLQLPQVKGMIKAHGFNVIKRKISWIGFDNDPRNTQPWTRSALALLIYAVKLKLGSMHGHQGQQTATQ